MEVEKETPIWYAMRATYRREPDAMRLLEKEKLGCFVPMQYKISIKKGKKVRVLVPVIHNLLFVHACPSEVKRIKSQVTYLQYITDTRSGQKIIISDSEMQRFIAVAGTYNDHLMYFQPLYRHPNYTYTILQITDCKCYTRLLQLQPYIYHAH